MVTYASDISTSTVNTGSQSASGYAGSSTLNAQSVSELPGSVNDFSQPVNVTYRGVNYTLTTPGQYQNFVLSKRAAEQDEATSQRHLSEGLTAKSPTLTALGPVNNIGGSVVPAGSQLLSSPLTAPNEAHGTPFTATSTPYAGTTKNASVYAGIAQGANYEDKAGQQYSVSYQQSGGNPVYQNGITNALASKGVFGSSDGFSGASFSPLNTPPLDFTPFYGYSTPHGETILTYGPTAKSNDISKSDSGNFGTPDHLGLGNLVSPSPLQNEGVVSSYARGVLSLPVGLGKIQAYLTTDSLLNIGSVVSPTASEHIRELMATALPYNGSQFFAGNAPFLADKEVQIGLFSLGTYAAGVGLPFLSAPLIGTSKLLSPIALGAGLSVGSNIVQNPSKENVAENIGLLSFGAGLGSAGKFLPAESLRVSPLSGGVTSTDLSVPDRISGTASLKGLALVDGQARPVDTAVIFHGERLDNSNLFGVRVTSESQLSLPSVQKSRFVVDGLGKSTLPESTTGFPLSRQTTTEFPTTTTGRDFLGVYNAQTNVLSIGEPGFFRGEPNAKAFIVQGGKDLTPVFSNGVEAPFSQSPSRSITLENSKAGVPLVTGTGRVSSLSQPFDFTKTSFQSDGKGFDFLLPSEKSSVNSQSLTVRQRAGGANTDLFRGGFQNFERLGLYRDRYRVQGPGLSLLESRRGGLQGPGGAVALPSSPLEVPAASSLKAPRSLELSGLPLEVNGPRSSSRPVFAPSFPGGGSVSRPGSLATVRSFPRAVSVPRQRSSLISIPVSAQRSVVGQGSEGALRFSQDVVQRPAQAQRSENAFRFSQEAVTAQDVGQRSENAFRFDQFLSDLQARSSRQSSPVKTDTSIMPIGGIFPPLNFALSDEQGKKKAGKTRKYHYAPDLTSNFFNIHGRRPPITSKGYSPVELRPLPITNPRKRKKKLF